MIVEGPDVPFIPYVVNGGCQYHARDTMAGYSFTIEAFCSPFPNLVPWDVLRPLSGSSHVDHAPYFPSILALEEKMVVGL